MEFDDYLRFLLALAFVLGLIGVFSVLVQRFGPRFGLGLRPPAARGKTRRLSLSEVMSLDSKRRCVLICRDEVEHLVIIGPHGETVIETNIPTTENKKTDEGEAPQ